ncbi:MAG TPA: hypothetical protein PLO64_07020 [Methanothermobacter sp.]|nr:conserved hypothetical protein [Methanothermobacter sp. MT-2]HHW04725.1 hypothetical protein [Methanothermobacter sp.]HOK72797.1 hypothetical protein [Methanothermobacter sp.]HOL69665.1 hypothetical protein [Methanothermobacter sp.]HPQ05263.1 hypothetical protein [Methanothermobacter sp.]
MVSSEGVQPFVQVHGQVHELMFFPFSFIGFGDYHSLNKISSLWVIVSSYHAMYYIANAVLYKFGYKIGHEISHKVTGDALIVFVRNKLKERFLEDFERQKIKL